MKIILEGPDCAGKTTLAGLGLNQDPWTSDTQEETLGTDWQTYTRDITVTGSINLSQSDIAHSRTIGDFSAAGATSGNDNWGTLTVEKSTGQVRPFAGYTMGSKSVDAYTETGDVQAILSHSAIDETFNYATIGINVDTGLVTARLARDFDDAETMHIGLGINKAINDNIAFNAGATRSRAGDNTSTTVTAGFKIQF